MPDIEAIDVRNPHPSLHLIRDFLRGTHGHRARRAQRDGPSDVPRRPLRHALAFIRKIRNQRLDPHVRDAAPFPGRLLRDNLVRVKPAEIDAAVAAPVRQCALLACILERLLVLGLGLLARAAQYGRDRGEDLNGTRVTADLGSLGADGFDAGRNDVWRQADDEDPLGVCGAELDTGAAVWEDSCQHSCSAVKAV